MLSGSKTLEELNPTVNPKENEVKLTANVEESISDDRYDTSIQFPFADYDEEDELNTNAEYPLVRKITPVIEQRPQSPAKELMYFVKPAERKNIATNTDELKSISVAHEEKDIVIGMSESKDDLVDIVEVNDYNTNDYIIKDWDQALAAINNEISLLNTYQFSFEAALQIRASLARKILANKTATTSQRMLLIEAYLELYSQLLSKHYYDPNFFNEIIDYVQSAKDIMHYGFKNANKINTLFCDQFCDLMKNKKYEDAETLFSLFINFFLIMSIDDHRSAVEMDFIFKSLAQKCVPIEQMITLIATHNSSDGTKEIAPILYNNFLEQYRYAPKQQPLNKFYYSIAYAATLTEVELAFSRNELDQIPSVIRYLSGSGNDQVSVRLRNDIVKEFSIQNAIDVPINFERYYQLVRSALRIPLAEELDEDTKIGMTSFFLMKYTCELGYCELNPSNYNILAKQLMGFDVDPKAVVNVATRLIISREFCVDISRSGHLANRNEFKNTHLNLTVVNPYKKPDADISFRLPSYNFIGRLLLDRSSLEQPKNNLIETLITVGSFPTVLADIVMSYGFSVYLEAQPNLDLLSVKSNKQHQKYQQLDANIVELTTDEADLAEIEKAYWPAYKDIFKYFQLLGPYPQEWINRIAKTLPRRDLDKNLLMVLNNLKNLFVLGKTHYNQTYRFCSYLSQQDKKDTIRLFNQLIYFAGELCRRVELNRALVLNQCRLSQGDKDLAVDNEAIEPINSDNVKKLHPEFKSVDRMNFTTNFGNHDRSSLWAVQPSFALASVLAVGPTTPRHS